jgi:hypothetical protein
MFATVESAEIHFASPSPNGNRFWSYAHIDLHTPWFYVEYLVNDGAVKVSSMLLLSTVDQLINFSSRPDMHLTQVHLISPGYLNNTGSWQMSALKEVIRAIQKVSGIEVPITIYRLDDGRELIYGLISKRNKLRNRRVVFPFQ